jgi:hypothetical protein
MLANGEIVYLVDQMRSRLYSDILFYFASKMSITDKKVFEGIA